MFGDMQIIYLVKKAITCLCQSENLACVGRPQTLARSTSQSSPDVDNYDEGNINYDEGYNDADDD